MGADHDYLVSPLNSLGMIDAYRHRAKEAGDEIDRAEKIARLPDHGELLDQVLLNEADLEVARGDPVHAAALLDEAGKLLKQAHPKDSANAWRYAVLDTVSAELVAINGDPASARRTLEPARQVILQRFGANGFYALLADRRARTIEESGH
jgi:ATP/maltotriose-dependent transcriptional regulator MalT